MKDIIIIGAGGVGRETAQLIEDINCEKKQWNLLGFIDDNKDLHGRNINGYEVLGGSMALNDYKGKIYAVCTISNPRIKQRASSKLKNNNMEYARLIHPTAVLSRHVEMGEDIIIQAFCFVSANVVIGSHVQLNPQCGIGHDSIIGDYSSLYWNVNISGNVRIEEGSLLGTKSTVLQGLTVGAWSIVGANSTIINDIPRCCTAVGTPAKPIKFCEEVT